MARAQEIIIEVGGMTCEHCEQRVTRALAAVPGVVRASVSRSEGHAVVTADPASATPEKLQESVREAGYEPGDVRFSE